VLAVHHYYPPRFNYPKIIRWSVQSMKLLVMPFCLSPLSPNTLLSISFPDTLNCRYALCKETLEEPLDFLTSWIE
jgi:hypothetical protein